MTTYKFDTFIICVLDSGQGHDIPLGYYQTMCEKFFFLKIPRQIGKKLS